jgi:hypothetical protein
MLINEKSMCIITKWPLHAGEAKIVNLNPAKAKSPWEKS